MSPCPWCVLPLFGSCFSALVPHRQHSSRTWQKRPSSSLSRHAGGAHGWLGLVDVGLGSTKGHEEPRRAREALLEEDAFRTSPRRWRSVTISASAGGEAGCREKHEAAVRSWSLVALRGCWVCGACPQFTPQVCGWKEDCVANPAYPVNGRRPRILLIPVAVCLVAARP